MEGWRQIQHLGVGGGKRFNMDQDMRRQNCQISLDERENIFLFCFYKKKLRKLYEVYLLVKTCRVKEEQQFVINRGKFAMDVLKRILYPQT